MKFAALSLAVVAALAVAGAASAASRVSDVDYLHANRCRGLASTITGVVDARALDEFVRAERGARHPFVYDRAQEEFQGARREAKSADRRERLTAELTGPCQAHLGATSTVARQ